MDTTAVALADLGVSLAVAANAYKGFAISGEVVDKAAFLRELSAERARNASEIRIAGEKDDLESIDPSQDRPAALELLGLAGSASLSLRQIAFRVQRAENMLGRLTSQLFTATPRKFVREALLLVQKGISDRAEQVRDFRYQARGLEASEPGRDYFFAGFTPTSPPARGSTPGEQPSTPGQQVTVWFGTNRADIAGRTAADCSDVTTYGNCQVFVPTANRSVGSLGSGPIGRMIHGDNRIRLISTNKINPQYFWREIQSELSITDDSDKHGLIFIHGYNTKFSNAALRTAQLKVDLKHKGPAAFFSWPSLGRWAGYGGDEAAMEGSEAPIRSFLEDFATRSGVTSVHIIAHSMGNRGLLRAMDRFAHAASTQVNVRFGQIILAAPDVDTNLFGSLASAYGKLSRRSTLYVSNNDFAVGISKTLHRYSRAGFSPPITIVKGIDTVDTSNVNFVDIKNFGHDYFVSQRAVLTDIYHLINGDLEPSKRIGLLAKNSGGGKYWELQPG